MLAARARSQKQNKTKNHRERERNRQRARPEAVTATEVTAVELEKAVRRGTSRRKVENEDNFQVQRKKKK